MKIVAWDERRFERDAQDLGVIMRNYLAVGNEDRITTSKATASIYSMKNSITKEPARVFLAATSVGF